MCVGSQSHELGLQVELAQLLTQAAGEQVARGKRGRRALSASAEARVLVGRRFGEFFLFWRFGCGRGRSIEYTYLAMLLQRRRRCG